MSKHEKFLKEQERLRKEEQKNNPMETFSDAFNRTHMPSLDGMTWRELGAVILFFLIIFVGYSLYKFLFN